MAENAYRRSLDKSLDPGLPGKDSRDAEKQARATEKLRAGEEAASAGTSSAPADGGATSNAGAASATAAAGEREVKPGFRFTGGGDDTQKTKAKGNFRKFGPIIAIAMAVFGAGSMIGWVQWLMPFAVVEQMTEMFDGSFTSKTARMPRLAKYILNLENDATETTQKRKTLFGEDYVKYRDSLLSRNKKKLAAQGIEIQTLEDTGEKVLIWKSDDEELPRVIRAEDYGEMYETNTKFRNDFNRGTRSFSGRISAWIDLSAARFFKNHNIGKNLFKDWSQKVIAAEGETTTFHDIITGRKPNSNLDVADGTSRKVEKEEVDSSGRTSRNTTTETNTQTRKAKGLDISGMISNISSVTVNATCATAAVAATFTGIKAAMALSNARNYWAAISEASDKVKGGDGEGSPIHEVGYDMTIDEGSGSALEAEGMKMVLSGGTYKPNQKEAVTASANVEELYSALGVTIGTVIGCAVANIVVSGVSIVLSAASLGTFSLGKAVVEFGRGAALAIGVTVGLELLVNSVSSNLETDFCVDKSGGERGTCMALGGSSALKTNFQNGGGTLASQEKIESFYEAHKLALAQEAEYDRATRSPFDVTNGNTFLGSLARKVALPIAEMTSPASFLSSLTNVTASSLASLLPSAAAIDKTEYLENQIGDCPILEEIGAKGDIYCNPIIVTDTATLDDDPEAVMNTVAELGGYEMETVKDENGKDVERVKLDENGVEIINAESNLGKYILYCANRTSPFGLVDQNITNSEVKKIPGNSQTGHNWFDNIINSIWGAIPIIGEGSDLATAIATLLALPWSTGANCVARGDGSTTLSGKLTAGNEGRGDDVVSYIEDGTVTMSGDTWTMQLDSWDEEMAYYQRYVEDDRVMESVNGGESSAVAAFLEHYETENPLDNSFEGILARETGYTKENIEIALNEALYWEYLASYDPTELYPVPVKSEDSIEFEQTEDFDDSVVAELDRKVVYAPLRSRNFAA